MKFKSLTLLAFVIACFFGCTEEKIVELPLVIKRGYGPFRPSLGGVSPYLKEENNPWSKTYLKVTGVPENLTEIEFGDIETNTYQNVYQNYLLGNITKEMYEDLQKTWDWVPDTLNLSKESLKCNVAFAYGKDSTGETKMIVDANNNLDFSDDTQFSLIDIAKFENVNKDSFALANAINITVEKFVDNKIIETQIPLFLAYYSQYNFIMCNFPQYETTEFEGVEIAICSNGFTNLSYEKPSVVLLSDSLKNEGIAGNENLISKNEYIEIGGKLYKNVGINKNHNTLVLEKVDLPKEQLYSTQIGYKTFPFQGSSVSTGDSIALNELKGKYVLLDFWAVWCGPCRQEIPNLKELYKKVDKEKFEIVGIVGDSPLEELTKLIEQDTINWPQILSTETNKVKEEYGIHGYPTTFLVDPEGIIIAKDLRGQALKEKVLGLLE